MLNQRQWRFCRLRLKDVAQEQYTMAEAERAAGKSIEEYKPAHVAMATS